ncbi:ABC transporter ATP-binding protein [Aestuariirhabdus sp. Z084]|uniref:ABC transporter ATP-binding protein n=1 Tax=Aestuariirhabdus haliotis TaxID=2918751 RepID=UPI00201B42A8|nr:ABC transporter ATP-binding protein [Aestuariirhabdus haliotis]MCL6416887.1 ABC transporter ATP-binding protein [Aestuariirhabdus haliotis]MCL6420894.1 ABC transporter ATP-binding protein [Aestuariirhabdus haliotis]
MTDALVISGLKKVYANGHEALKGIDFKVEQGDFFALLGPNGAGKSTTIGIISSLVTKSEGKVSIFGYDLDTELSLAKQNLGVVPQEFNFNQFEKPLHILITQAGYYGIPRAVARERAEFYLKKLGIWDKRDEQSRLLSGGMKRRLMIARALIHKPKLLILDEPTAGVDIELRRSMWEFLRDINDKEGVTIILTTHYLEEAEQLCRHIAIIDKGNLIENSSMKQLLSKLSVETFVLDCRQPLPESISVEGYSLRRVDEYSLEVEVSKSQTINAVFIALENLGIEVSSMRNRSNRLEELFVSLVEKQEGLL